MHIKHCCFGRDILHCIESVNFNPWSIMERIPPAQGVHDIFLLYACGDYFALEGARLRLEVTEYNEGDRRDYLENYFQVVYDEPLVIDGQKARGYNKSKIGSFNLIQHGRSQFMAFRATIYANADSHPAPLMRDFFIEGFTLHG